jgi:hypothetical protein
MLNPNAKYWEKETNDRIIAWYNSWRRKTI